MRVLDALRRTRRPGGRHRVRVAFDGNDADAERLEKGTNLTLLGDDLEPWGRLHRHGVDDHEEAVPREDVLRLSASPACSDRSGRTRG